MSPTPESIQLAIADLEARSRDFETRAGECRETAATLRRLYDVSTLSAPTPAVEKPSGKLPGNNGIVISRPPPTEPDASRVPEASRQRAAALREAILACLRRKTAPITVKELRGSVVGKAPFVRQALEALIVAGDVARVGNTSQTRIGLPAVMSKAAAKPSEARPDAGEQASAAQRERQLNQAANDKAALARTEGAERVLALLGRGGERTSAEVRRDARVSLGQLRDIAGRLMSARQIVRVEKPNQPTRYRMATDVERANVPRVTKIPVPAGIDPHALAQKVAQVFASGASYDLKDVFRNCRGTFPQIDEPTIAKVVDTLFGEGKLQRIPMASTVRYQRVAKYGEKATA